MPKSVDIADFAAKLALLTKRLNWSRAKLAQQVGVDKSLVARWMNGASRPTGNSLMQLTAAAAQDIENFTGADWDLGTAQFARRLGVELAPVPAPTGGGGSQPGRLMLSGLRNPTAPATWGTAYVGLWAGFYQSLTNRGVARMVVSEFVIDDAGLRFAISDGFFNCAGAALATHAHVHAICEIAPLDNHLMFLAFNAAHDMHGIAVIDGLMSAIGPDNTPSSVPLVLFRIDDAPPASFPAVMAKAAAINDRIESEAARTGDPFAHAQQFAPKDILRTLYPVVGTARADGATDHMLRIPSERSLATGKRAMANLPPGAPLRAVPGNLRRALGLEAADAN